MRIYFIPVGVSGKLAGHAGNDSTVFLRREGKLKRFMDRVQIRTDPERGTRNLMFTFCGELVDDCTFSQLQDGDILFYTISGSYTNVQVHYAFHLDMYANGEMLMPFPGTTDILELAAGMENHPEVYLYTSRLEDTMNKAQQIASRTRRLYSCYPAFEHIMFKGEDGPVAMSLTKVAAMQEPEVQKTLIPYFLAISPMTSSYGGNSMALRLANRILETCTFTNGFSLMTQEEQVEAFIDFSRMAAHRKQEYVPDTMIRAMKSSPEYARVREILAEHGLGESETQQFNVFQQVGFFSQGSRKENILYNLSDMGAGKTLMTVEAIFLMDLKRLHQYTEMLEEKGLVEDLEIADIYLPEKHLIAPTLSVKSSWIDTFRLFYDVVEDEEEEFTFHLTLRDGNRVAKSTIHVAPFTVKDGKIFVRNRLPELSYRGYLIIDEIHQLVVRNVAKTKFFQPGTKPCDIYQIFVLSGTMSNLQTAQWYNYRRFLGLPVSNNTVAQAETETNSREETYHRAIKEAAQNIKAQQHRYFDVPDLTEENTYHHSSSKKQTAYEREFFTRYSSQILDISQDHGEAGTVKLGDLLTEATRNAGYRTVADPVEADTINFELFYKIVGSQAITAQSTQIAEELFGEQKKQHLSEIIKTVSPLSKEDVKILKVLHQIAEDHAKYKSVTIAKAINNAILNLNDGLQTKNIYDIVSGFAERNIRFFEYLATLDVNILEQLPKSGLIQMPKLQDTDKFKVLTDILEREKEETHLIVVNDFYALKSLSEALGIEHLTKKQLRDELSYQETLDALFERQSIVVVTQDMIKSSLDLVQANRLIQYQLNTEISDIIQTQNRINRIGQTRETRGYYIATDQLQENLIELFLESYRNIRVAHKGIVELFTDITSQINVINDYLERAFKKLDDTEGEEPAEIVDEEAPEEEAMLAGTDLDSCNLLPDGSDLASGNEVSPAILYPQNGSVLVLLPLTNGNAFPVGTLRADLIAVLQIQGPVQVKWNVKTNQLVREET